MKQKKKKLLSKQNVISLFIILIMILSAMGYMLGRDSEERLKYKEYSFLREGNSWALKINKDKFSFDYFPKEVENLSISPEITDALKGKVEIDATSNPDERYKEEIAKAQYDLGTALDKLYGTYFVIGMTKENDFNLSITTCRNATSPVPVIYFAKSNSTNISFENNCVIIEAEHGADILKIKDRIIYGLLGVIH